MVVDPFSVIAAIELAAATAEKLYNFGKTVYGARDEMRGLIKKANSLRVVLQYIDQESKDPKFQSLLKNDAVAAAKFAVLEQPLLDCNDSMNKFLDLLNKNTKDSDSGTRKAIQSVKWFYIKDSIMEIRDELADARDTCTFAFAGMNMITNIHEKIESAERTAVLDEDRESRSPNRSISELQQQRSDFRHAARDGDTVLVKRLLDEGVPVDCLNRDGRTALSLAAERGFIDTVCLLLDNNANVNFQSDEVERGSYTKQSQGRRSPLHWAALGGHVEVAELLLAKGASLEARTYNGRSPVLEAALHNQFQMMEYLIDCGADVNARTTFGWTMLHHACGNGQPELVKLLLNHGANVEAVYSGYHWSRGTEGPTEQRPLHYAVKKRNIPEAKKLEIVELLLEQGNAKIGAPDSDGITAIHATVIRGWRAGLEVLLKRASKLDIDIRDKDVRTALDYAIEQGDAEVVDMIHAAQGPQSGTDQPLQTKPPGDSAASN